MSNPIDLVKNYIDAKISRVPQTPYMQEQSEHYSAKNEDDNNDEYSRKRREEEEEPIPTREEYEANQKEGEREIEYNSQRELDDLEESEPYNDEYNRLEDNEFSGNYFEKPDSESEPKSSLGDKIRAKYDSFSEKAGSAAGSFVGGFNKKMDSFERGDPLFSTGTKRPAKGRSIRYVSRPTRQNKNLSRPYVGGRFNDSFSLGASNTNPYYPVNAGQQSVSAQPTMDAYLPSGPVYEGEFSGRKAFKREFSDERESYDPFGYGGLSGNGFDNTSPFGSSLMSFGDDNGLFSGMNGGTDTVFGNGSMFNAPRGKAKKEVNGFGLNLIIGDSGGMYNTIDPSPRKTTKRKSTTRKTAKKVSKAKPTKRKSASTRRQTYKFALP